MLSKIYILLKQLISEWNKFSDEKCILIYQMGKVGSTSIEKSLPNSIHLHTLYANYVAPFFYRVIYGDIKSRLVIIFRNHVRLYALKKRRKVKIITLVREPSSRNVSMFFHDLASYIMDYMVNINPESRDADMEWLYRVYEDSFDHSYCDTWFDKELKRLTDIDVFQYKFDIEKGYIRIQKGRYDILLIRTEDMNKNLQVISDFCGSEIILQTANIGGQKWYAPIYHEFESHVSKHSKAFNQTASGRIARHFYNR